MDRMPLFNVPIQPTIVNRLHKMRSERTSRSYLPGMNNIGGQDHERVPKTSFVWLLVAGMAMAACGSNGRSTTRNTIPFTDLFTIRVDSAGGETYLNMQPDSVPGDSQLNARCTALYNYHDYLFENYAQVLWKEKELLAILPDTVAMRTKFHALLESDTAFRKLYMRSIDQDTVAPLPMDSAFWIAAHFFYLHRMNGRPTAHICVGINKVKEMSGTVAHPYHAAFCFMAVWGMDDTFGLLDQAIGSFKDELKTNPSDERLIEMQHAVYHTLAHSPELRKAVLDTYKQKARYLNFKLVK